MTAQIEKLDEQIQKIEQEFQEFLAKQESERRKKEAARDEKMLRLQAERTELALQEKLKEYPAELVNNHKTCKICGNPMRPFKIAKGNAVVKYWACSNGNLSHDHDIIQVE